MWYLTVDRIADRFRPGALWSNYKIDEIRIGIWFQTYRRYGR
ncbi:MAG: hypothetical protein PVF26_18360 [Desulfobacterales bacterium]